MEGFEKIPPSTWCLHTGLVLGQAAATSPITATCTLLSNVCWKRLAWAQWIAWVAKKISVAIAQ